ncbi:hypothetical protein ACFL3S_10935, partial [Gemmatimonadota bacterium]
EVDRFIESLGGEGIPEEILGNAEAQGYLSWRARIAFAERADHSDHALEFRAEKDRVLAEALSLLGKSDSQADLFIAAEARAAQINASQASEGLPGSGS